jgi:coenzyme F420 hydrogenase subunit delta
MIAELMSSRLLILGCGNTLFGDDGFGPEVIQALEKENLEFPKGTAALDVGTSLSDLLFDLALSQQKPELLLILDAVDLPGRKPGELFELELEEIPDHKQSDFSMHQFPAINLLQELRSQGGVEFRILAVQIKQIPEEVEPGLSAEVQAALPRACKMVQAICNKHSQAAAQTPSLTQK